MYYLEKGFFLRNKEKLTILFVAVFVATFALGYVLVVKPIAPSGQAFNAELIAPNPTPLPEQTPLRNSFDFASNLNSLPGSPSEFKAQIRDTEMGMFDGTTNYTYNGQQYSTPTFESIGIGTWSGGDARFDYTHIAVDDLVAYLYSEGDFNYTITLDGGSSNPALGIPLDFDSSTGDSARIPFLGKMYDLLEISSTPPWGSYVTVKLFDGINTITLIDGKGYPYDPNNQTGQYDWKVKMQYDNADSNKLESISIVNSNMRWDDSNPIYANGKAKFVDNYATFEFKGFESKPTTQLTIGESCGADGGSRCIKYTDGNNLARNIPFFIKVADNTTSSFLFDGTTYYYFTSRVGAGTGSIRICKVAFGANHSCNTTNTVLDQNYIEDRISLSSFKLKQPFYFRYMVTETYGHVWLLLTDDGGAIQTKFDKRISLIGTDLRESGSAGFQAFIPDDLEFSNIDGNGLVRGNPIDTNYFTAHFAIDSDNDGAAETTVFVDTATGRLVNLPNNNLNYYDSDVWHIKGPVQWKLRWDSPQIYSSRGYTDFGSKLEVLEENGGQCTQNCNLIFKATMPKTRAKVLASVYR